MNKSLFEKETLQFGDSFKSLIWIINSVKDALKHNSVADVIYYSKYSMNLSDKLYDFLEKYNLFFEILRKKFGLDISACNSLKMGIGETKRKLQQVIIFASEGKMDFANRLVTEIDESHQQLYLSLIHI